MTTNELNVPTKKLRHLLPENLAITSWQQLHIYFQELTERPIASADDLKQWLLDRSELNAVISEHAGWNYIKMTCDTLNKNYAEAFAFFVSNIEPHIAAAHNSLNIKLIQSPFLKDIEKGKYSIYIREIRKELTIFRESNISLFTDLQIEAQQYAVITSAMTVIINEEEVTMQKAATYLKNINREMRAAAYSKIKERRAKETEKLDALFTQLTIKRHQVAINAGYDNFRDYSFTALGRFDYTANDCYLFHDSIAQEIMPIVEQLDKERQKKLGIELLKPWDREVDVFNRLPLTASTNTDELLEKTILCLTHIHPYFGECLQIMKVMGHLDLASRKAKAPGGYNYPLHEIGVPFIFMNSVGSLRDLVTMVHESGHAVHSFLCRELEITDFKNTPSEVAELASMSMELISMEHWNVFFKDEADLKRAKKEQLEKVINLFPWIAAVDSFQHWVYTNPTHTTAERTAAWNKIMLRFNSNVIDWTNNETALATAWQSQLHIFEIPFYYIEYGIAQLGAIAIWRNYKNNSAKTLEAYINALKLGYTTTIEEIYTTAEIEFNFSPAYVKELMNFVKSELALLE